MREDRGREPRWLILGCFALLLVGVQLTAGQRIRISEWHVKPETNAALEEALQWKKGRLDLAMNDYEVARTDDRRFNVVGLAFVLISLVGTTLTQLAGAAPESFYPPYYVMLVGLPLPVAAFAAFRTVTGCSVRAAVLAGHLIIATSLLPILEGCRGGTAGASIYFINHLIAVTGLLIFAADLLGPRRIWPGLIGLCLAAWSRQLTALYLLPLAWLVWRGIPAGSGSAKVGTRSVLAGAIVIAAVPMTLNYLKFGSPLDTGYGRIYEGRSDPIGLRGSERLFSTHYLAHNAAAMNLNYPSWDIRGGALYPDCSAIDGASIWLTTPILIGIAATARSWWRDRVRRALALATLPVITGLLLYHTTGSQGAGHYRYALDFLPIWMLIIAPHAVSPRGMPWTLGCMAYSSVYFSLLP
ncbi:MAG: hypothetical protein DCC65_02095 [Planctomycetota bacterium]|nr:MAG: hypothetical protein DCC65_02095 [Planctomycetota bacterium]